MQDQLPDDVLGRVVIELSFASQVRLALTSKRLLSGALWSLIGRIKISNRNSGPSGAQKSIKNLKRCGRHPLLGPVDHPMVMYPRSWIGI
jgi:hypothetical protein